ncbi:MAG: DnaD domain protein, partial [Clostridiales bacterium]|nr:DnaD domain protein [Clostridiales bacterium]
TNFDIEFISLRQLFIDKNYYNPQKSQTLITKSVKENHYSTLFKRLNKKLGNELQANERIILMEFLDKNNTNDALVIEAFNSLRRGAYTSRINTVKKRLFNWKDLNINTIDDLLNYKNKTSETYLNYKKILEALGHPWDNPSSGDKEVIDKWMKEYNFNISFILEKIKEITKKTRNPNMNYLDIVFTSIYKGEEPTKKNKPVNKSFKKKNTFHNFSTTDENDLTEKELEKILVRNIKPR